MKRPIYVYLRTGGDLPWAYNLLELAMVCEGETFTAKVRAAPEGIEPALLRVLDLEAHNAEGQPLSRVFKDLVRWLNRQANLHSTEWFVPVSWKAGPDHMWLRRCEYIAALDLPHLEWDEHLDLRSMCIAEGATSARASTDWDIVDALQVTTGEDEVRVQMDDAVAVARALALLGEGYFLADMLA